MRINTPPSPRCRAAFPHQRELLRRASSARVADVAIRYEPCFHCDRTPELQAQEMMRYLETFSILPSRVLTASPVPVIRFSRVWVHVDATPRAWSGEPTANVDFLRRTVNEFTRLGADVGSTL